MTASFTSDMYATSESMILSCSVNGNSPARSCAELGVYRCLPAHAAHCELAPSVSGRGILRWRLVAHGTSHPHLESPVRSTLIKYWLVSILEWTYLGSYAVKVRSIVLGIWELKPKLIRASLADQCAQFNGSFSIPK